MPLTKIQERDNCAAGGPLLITSEKTERSDGLSGRRRQAKILQIGNYPPPLCGWAIQTKLVTDELRRRGHVCDVLKINENHTVKDPAYIDVQDGWDYLQKIVSHALCGYRLNVHVNGMSK